MRELAPPAVEAPLLPWLLTALAPTNRTRVKDILHSGRVQVNGVSVTRHDHQLLPGDAVRITRDAPDPRVAGLTIVHEDDAVVVIDKPSGLLTVSAGPGDTADTAFARLTASLAKRRAGRPFVVHRLDRGTSGLLLFARSAADRDRLQANWDAVTKTYVAVVEGVPQPAEGAVDNYLTEGQDLRVRASRSDGPGAKRAVTRYRVTAVRGRFARVEVVIDTGRKHQIRVHLAGLGCPVIGDVTYGAKLDPAGRLGLHAFRLAFDHPATGRRVEVESPLPRPLGKVLG